MIFKTSFNFVYSFRISDNGPHFTDSLICFFYGEILYFAKIIYHASNHFSLIDLTLHMYTYVGI